MRTVSGLGPASAWHDWRSVLATVQAMAGEALDALADEDEDRFLMWVAAVKRQTVTLADEVDAAL